MAEPRVSALICVRNGERFLGEAIESVLAQTVAPLELIVAEDGSTDGTADVARSYGSRVRLLELAPCGLGAARNAAVAAAAGELTAFLDHDDLWEPNKLELQLRAFAENPELQICFCHCREFAAPADAARFAVREGAIEGVLASALLARREAIEAGGGFEEGVAVGELMAWLLRARELGLAERVLPDVLVHRRIHADNTTRRRRDSYGDFAKMLKDSLDRRRESA